MIHLRPLWSDDMHETPFVRTVLDAQAEERMHCDGTIFDDIELERLAEHFAPGPQTPTPRRIHTAVLVAAALAMVSLGIAAAAWVNAAADARIEARE